MGHPKQAWAVVISIFVLVGVLPAAFALPTTFLQGSPVMAQNVAPWLQHIPNAKDFMPPLYRHASRMKPIPLSEYERLVSFHFGTFNAKTMAEALQNAPSYPGRSIRSSYAILPNGFVVLNTSALPNMVVNTLYLPPIGDQGYVGSCNAWSSTYYVWTYMINWWRNHPHPNSSEDIMNPTFTYNLINGGEDRGSIPWDAMNLISTIGAVPLSDFPLYNYPPFPDNYAWVWPNLTQWEEAPHNSANFLTYLGGLGYVIPGMWYLVDLTNNTQWDYTKALLARGYVLQTTINVLPSFQFLDHPESLLGFIDFYISYSKRYSKEYWTNQTFDNGTYTKWTVGDVLNYAAEVYTNKTGESINSSVNLIKVVLSRFNVSVNDSVGLAVLKIENGFNSSYLHNQSWWNNATFYLSTYSINGEKWLLNHGFDTLYAVANFEWMLHYIPIGRYSYWPWWFFLNFNNYYYGWQGGHAVTIIGYNDTAVTPDGHGALIMVNSWGTEWGDNGYWEFSYQAIRSGGETFNVSVDGVLTTSFQVEWPVSWGGSTAFVYVPKKANYTPTAMITLGIRHPLRGEIIDGIYDYQNDGVINGGIPVALYAVEGNQKVELWAQNFLDFWIDYIWTNTTTPVNLPTWMIPQAHPFPTSPMSFDITEALERLSDYVNSGHPMPSALEVVVRLSDKVIDNYTGTVYEYGLTLITPDGHKIQVTNENLNLSIPQGNYTYLIIRVPLAQLKKYVVSHGHRGIIRKSKFEVTAITVVKPEGAYLYIKSLLSGKVKKFRMSTTDGFYFAINGSALKGLKPGPYKYWIVFVYKNGQKLTLPAKRVNLGR